MIAGDGEAGDRTTLGSCGQDHRNEFDVRRWSLFCEGRELNVQRPWPPVRPDVP